MPYRLSFGELLFPFPPILLKDMRELIGKNICNFYLWQKAHWEKLKLNFSWQRIWVIYKENLHSEIEAKRAETARVLHGLIRSLSR